MASFQEKFKNRVSMIGKKGEFSMSQARPVAAIVPEGKSHFHYAAAAVIAPSPQLVEQGASVEQRSTVPIFAKPICITRKVISDSFSECAAPMKTAQVDMAMSETATVANRKVCRSIDFHRSAEDPAPASQ